LITLPSFRLHRPRALGDALRVLAEHQDDARILAGGTDLVVNLRNRLFTPSHVVSIAGIRGLDGIAAESGGGLRVGALARVSDIASHPIVRSRFAVLARAAEQVAGPTLRSMGTAGGNICLDTRCQWYNQSYFWRAACGFCLKKDGDFCHVAPGSNVCWAAYSGDLAPAFLVLDAEVAVRSERGERTIPLHRFFIEDGGRKFDLARDEILVEIRVPASRAGCRGFYGKLRSRGSIDFPLAGVAVAARVGPDGTFRDAAIAVTAAGPRPFLVEGAQEILEGKRVDDADAIERAAHLARRTTNPLHTTSSTTPGYRRHRIGLFARDALRSIAREPGAS
jgi:4-hydroxybenzoyl-CoA reductase subunit beta